MYTTCISNYFFTNSYRGCGGGNNMYALCVPAKQLFNFKLRANDLRFAYNLLAACPFRLINSISKFVDCHLGGLEF